MFGAIILRDVPKKEARIDLTRHQIQGGFRGFSMVPPAAWHYVSVKHGAHHVGFWCYLEPRQAVVKVFDPETGFQDADTEIQAQFAGLALSGAMGPALLDYPHAQLGPWLGMVNHIPQQGFPPQLFVEEEGPGSRFDKAYLNSHSGDAVSFLAEFQYAFASWLVSLDAAAQDQAAFERWRHLVLAAYNAGEDRIRAGGTLFAQLVDVMLHQLGVLPDEWFTDDSFLVSSQAGYMSEDMVDTGIPELVEKGQAFESYLAQRRQ